MIRYLEGTVQTIHDNALVVLVQGVGYEVFVPQPVLDELQHGVRVVLHIYHHIREDAMHLYGFPERAQLQFFETLLRVSGVGPRLAMALLSQLPVEQIKKAIIHGDIPLLHSVSGVGRKTAERIVLDLKESIDVLTSDAHAATLPSAEAQHGMSVINALTTLGYSKAEALNAFKNVDTSQSLEDQVRQALRGLGS